MKIESKIISGVLILTLEEKRLDSKLAVGFKEKVSELVQDGSRLIALDLSQVDFIDSSGIGCLVSCLKLLGPRGRIVVWGLKPAVETMFKLTRMDRVFTICPTEEQALAAINS